METSNRLEESSRKVYCSGCNYYWSSVSRKGHRYAGCNKMVGHTDTPVCRRTEYLQCNIANKSNACPHYEPKPAPQPKKSIWKKLFGGK